VAYPVAVDWQEGERLTVSCYEDLARLLDRIALEADTDHPPLVVIENDGGSLFIGVGATVGTVSHVPPSGDPPYMICLGDAHADGVIDFYYLGDHSQFLLRNTIPNELARAAAVEYAESGTLPDSVTWEEG
jgi:hypothetical protein